MSLKEKIKQNSAVRAIGKSINIHKEFSKEKKSFLDNYMEVSTSQKAYEYKMLLIVHGIEKGMTIACRPFGEKKIVELSNLINGYLKSGYSLDTTAYSLSVSIVNKWIDYHVQKKWNTPALERIREWIDSVPAGKDFEAGIKVMKKVDLLAPTDFNFAKFAESRRSVRNFAPIPLKDDDVLECIRIALLAPTACNRQMVKICRITDEQKCKYMLNHIIGISGFDNETVSIFVLAYDIASLNYYGERNQGYFNAGLVGMTFTNALHSKGIGSCFLQWSNTLSETATVKDKLGIPEDVCIVGILAAGYYADESVIPMSTRKQPPEIYCEL